MNNYELSNYTITNSVNDEWYVKSFNSFREAKIWVEFTLSSDIQWRISKGNVTVAA